MERDEVILIESWDNTYIADASYPATRRHMGGLSGLFDTRSCEHYSGTKTQPLSGPGSHSGAYPSDTIVRPAELTV